MSLGAGFPLHLGERLQAGSGFASTAFDLYPAGRSRAGVAAAAHIGYNWELSPWVWGVETEFGLLDGQRGPSGAFAPPVAVGPFGVSTYQISANPSGTYSASLRARLGFAFDRALVYLTSGVAAGGWRGPSTLTLFGLRASANLGGSDRFLAGVSQSSRMKYVIGAGLEYAFANQWSARAEYLFLNPALNTQVFDNGVSFQLASRTRNEHHLLRGGLSYHFDSDDAAKEGSKTSAEDGSKLYSILGQSTHFVQGYPKFPALYSGQNSFPPQGEVRAGSVTDVFFGVRLWQGASVFVDPEIIQGYGLHNSFGAASYVNSVAEPQGAAAPYMRFQRYFLRQTIGLGGGVEEEEIEQEGSKSKTLESEQSRLAGKVARDRLIFTIGKFAVSDVFDDNIYAHDPTTGFLNFAFNNMLAFDYAQDGWGYSYGAAAEWRQNWWSARAGVFQLPQIPNGNALEPELFRQYMAVAEFEGRYDLFGQPGEIKFLAYGDNGYFSKIDDVIAYAYLTRSFPPQVSGLRKRRLKTGGGINIEQRITSNLAFFLRASMLDGRYETVAYTDVDRSMSAGMVASGAMWDRPNDEVGVAAVVSGLTSSRAKFFALGGLDAYIGDGALSYTGEKALEAYYKIVPFKGLEATLDYQLLVDPGYNAARGPVNVFGLRLNAKF